MSVSLEGESWERQLVTGHGASGTRSLALEGLTLEAILRAWTRDPDRLADAKRRAERYLQAVIESAADASEDVPEEEIESLRQFERTWQVVTSTLAGSDV